MRAVIFIMVIGQRWSVTLWFPKDNLKMPSRIKMKFGIHNYFVNIYLHMQPGIVLLHNHRIFNRQLYYNWLTHETLLDNFDLKIIFYTSLQHSNLSTQLLPPAFSSKSKGDLKETPDVRASFLRLPSVLTKTHRSITI